MTKLFRKGPRIRPSILSHVQHAGLFRELPVVQIISKNSNQTFVHQFHKFLSQKNRRGFICKTPYRAEKPFLFHAFHWERRLEQDSIHKSIKVLEYSHRMAAEYKNKTPQRTKPH